MQEPPLSVSVPPRRAAVAFILVTLGIDALGVGLVIPITPELVRQLTGGHATGAAFAVGLTVAVFAFAQLLASPILGALSDRFGRRPVMLLSISGIAANYVLLAWAPSLAWLYLGRLLAGATSANVSTASAYIADVSTPVQRARRFGLVGATFGAAFVFGPALGGWLGGISLRLPFVVAAALAGANALYGLLVLPESLPPERRQPFAWHGANPVAALRYLAADRVLRRLAVAWSCLTFGMGALQAVFVLSTAQRFAWGPPQNGAALAAVGLSGAMVQGLLVRGITARLGDRGAVLLGTAANAVAYVGFGLAPVGWAVYPAIAAYALGQVASPALRALVSAQAGPERQGRTMGALSVVEGLTAIAGPLIASLLFVRLTALPFLAAAALFLVAFAAVRRLPSG